MLVLFHIKIKNLQHEHESTRSTSEWFNRLSLFFIMQSPLRPKTRVYPWVSLLPELSLLPRAKSLRSKHPYPRYIIHIEKKMKLIETREICGPSELQANQPTPNLTVFANFEMGFKALDFSLAATK